MFTTRILRDAGTDLLAIDHLATRRSQDSRALSKQVHRLRAHQFLRSKADIMWKPAVLLAAALAVPAQALHFFIDGAVQKCFFEELPKDTLVVGMTAL